ncbi:response regulator [Cellulomonas biazotea]|uniref:Response regulator n=1 Tax=Cellulomonas biazotea TaxID=1709 RepID=A0A402DUD1_9CELL|nr:response regulator [Cellulomonas biazotea]GCE77717.1 response regulator [Cellulomonas biazotea]
MRALVVDDSRTMRRIVAKILEGLGYETSQAENGQEALDALQQGDAVDLVTVDWNMPVMDGLELVGHVRKNRDLRSVTLMMVTTEAEQSQIVRALAAGAHEYLIKPFTAEELRAKLDLLGLVPLEETA